MGLGPEDLTILVDAFERSAWTEMILQVDGTRLELTSTGLPPAPRPGELAPPPASAAAAGVPAPAALAPTGAPAPAAAAAAAGTPGTAGPSRATHEVVAPSVGIFYRAPEPGAPPFVDAGAHVEPDDVVCIVEVMKLMNHVVAGVAGTVREVHVENGTMIEHGQVLFTIEAGA